MPKSRAGELRAALRLCVLLAHDKVSRSRGDSAPRGNDIAPTPVTHRYEEQIAGRTYLIEVLPVPDSRWRAQIVARPGMPTSLMPFYGATPEQAVSQLSRWLALVYNGSNSL